MKVVFTLLIAMLVIFSACKKKEAEVNKCENGYLDPGETAPDCGGKCPPCENTAPALFYVEMNGSEIMLSSRELNYDQGNWSLVMTNDSLNIQLNLGSDGNVGTFPMQNQGTFAFKNGTNYPIQEMGSYSISAHDQAARKMSGFFQIRFLRQFPNNPLLYDTLELTSGQFENMNY